MLSKTAGQKRAVVIMKPDGRLFGDPWVRFWSRSFFSVSARAAMRVISYIGIVVRLRSAFARHYGSARCKGLFSFRPQEKEKARSDEPKRELEARRGTGPHTRRGCTVLDLGRCTGTYCFGVAGKLGRGPAFARQKYRYGFSRSCETVLNDLCTQGTCARQGVKALLRAIKLHLTQ